MAMKYPPFGEQGALQPQGFQETLSKGDPSPFLESIQNELNMIVDRLEKDNARLARFLENMLGHFPAPTNPEGNTEISPDTRLGLLRQTISQLNRLEAQIESFLSALETI